MSRLLTAKNVRGTMTRVLSWNLRELKVIPKKKDENEKSKGVMI